MTKLTFTGQRGGKDISITWEDGTLSGDADTVDWIRYIARIAEASGTIVGGIGGPYASGEYLEDPYAAAELIRSVFPAPPHMEGELPERYAPPGAII
jgi:hypothetical protein